MTRAEFIENVTNFEELREFCIDNDCDVVGEIFDEYTFDRRVNDRLSNWVGDYDWYDIKSMLNDIPTGYSYYTEDDDGDFQGLDANDFRSMFDDVLEWGDDYEIWDDDEEEEYTPSNSDDEPQPVEEIPDPEDEIPLEYENVSFDELFSSCNDTIQIIRKKAEDKAAAEEAKAAAELAEEEEEEFAVVDEDEFNEFINDITNMVERSA